MPSMSSVRLRWLIVGTVTGVMIVPQSLLAYCIDHVEQLRADSQQVAFLPARGGIAFPKIDKEKFRRELAQRKIGALTRLMEKEGQTTQRLLERAKLHMELEQTQKAVEDYDAIIKLEPKNAEHREARLALNQQLHQYDAVEADLNELIKLDPSLNRYLDRANFHYDRLNTQKAVQDYTKVIELDDSIAEVYTRRGHIVVLTKAPRVRVSPETIRDFQKAIELDPDQILAHRDLTIIYLNSAQFAQAERHATEILKRKEEDECARFYRAKAYRRLGRFKEAIEDLNILLDAPNRASNFIIERALTYRDMKEVDKAIQDYQWAIEIEPNNFATHAYLARYLLSNKRFEEAIPHYEKAIELNRDQFRVQAEFYAELANAEFWVGNLEKSEQYFGKATELKPTSSYYKLQRADVLCQLKKFDEALAIYDAMLNLSQVDSTVYERRARVYLIQGELDKAMNDIDEYVRLAKNRPEGYQLRAKIWKKKGNEEQAAADLKNAEEAAERLAAQRAKAKAIYEANQRKREHSDKQP